MTSKFKGGAMPMGMRQKDGFLWKGDERIDCPDENDLFEAIDVPFVAVDMRDDGKWREVAV